MKTLSLLLFLFFSLNTFSYQEAVVTASRAIIYSDTSLDTPLGYVKKSKSIYIGDKRKRKGRIVAVALVGRIGWIKVEDIKIKSAR